MDPRGGGVRAALGAPIESSGPEPPDKPPNVAGVGAGVSQDGGSGPIGSRELHLLGAVSAASGSGALSASGRRRSRRVRRQLDAGPNAEVTAIPRDVRYPLIAFS